MAKRKIGITVPDFRPLIQLWKNLKYRIKPYRCEVCDDRLNFRSPDYELCTSAGRVMVSSPYSSALCRTDLVLHIRRMFELAPSNKKLVEQPPYIDSRQVLTIQPCDCCGQEKPTLGIGNRQCDIRFGTRWWNGFWLCEDCLVKTVQRGIQKSGRITRVKKKLYYINEAGALIPYEFTHG